MSITVGVFWDTATINGISWKYSVSGGKAKITGASPVSGYIKIPSEIDGYSVTSIGSKAFADCGSLTSVVIGNSLTSIGDMAFADCDSLKEFVVSPNNPDYKSVNGLLLSKDGKTLIAGVNGDITIPDSVTSIGGGAFRGCSNLTSVVIPNSVTSIGYSAFEDCSSLTSVVIGNSVTSIGGGAFRGCSNLTSVVIPDSVTSIESEAFWGCRSLTSVVIPDSVTSIGYSAFKDCGSLTSVVIGNSVTSIGVRAFAWCGRLMSVVIPNSVTSIESEAFWGCRSLTEAIFLGNAPKSVGVFRGYIFVDCPEGLVIKVKRGTTGWDGDYTSTALPDKWRGYPIRYCE